MDLPAQQPSFHQSKWWASSIWGRGSRYHWQNGFFAEWTAQLPGVVASKVINSIVGMVFGWLVCVNWLLGERETFICKVQPTMKCREKQSLIFTLYLSEEPQCTNIVIFMPSLAGISNLHSCCCLLAFSFYKHFLAFIPFLLDHGPLTLLNCTHHPHHCAAQSGRTSADPKLKSLMLCLWCLSMSLWVLGAAALQQNGSQTS